MYKKYTLCKKFFKKDINRIIIKVYKIYNLEGEGYVD